MTPRQLEQARNIQRNAGKLLDAADAGDDQLFEEYAADLELAITEVVDEIEEQHKTVQLRRRNLIPPVGHPPELMTREEDQLQRESDDRAAFNDRLDQMRFER